MAEFKPIHTMWLPDSAHVWESLAHHGKVATYEPNAIIADRNTNPDLFYLHQGRVKFIAIGIDGQEKVLYYCRSGTLFGECQAVLKTHLAHTYVAMDKCTVYKFDLDKILDKLLREYPEHMYSLLYSAAYKATLHARNISTMALLDSDAQVARTLYGMIVSNGGQTKVHPAMTQQEVANVLGLHRTTLTRILSGLKRDGILVRYTKNILEITDLQKLKEAAQIF